MAAPKAKARVKIEGIKELMARLEDPALIQEPLKDLLTECAQVGHDAATKAVEGGTGIAVRSINTWVNPMFSRVTSAMPKARSKSIDQGRKAGGPMPAEGPIMRWMKAVGADTSTKGSIYKMRLRIAAQGVTGKAFLKAARTAVADAMPRLRDAMDRKIERHFK